MTIDVKTILRSNADFPIFGVASGTFANNNHSVTAFITNTSITSSSKVSVTVGMPTNRDLDEMELAPVAVATKLSPGAGFFIIGTSTDGNADGTYLFNYTISLL